MHISSFSFIFLPVLLFCSNNIKSCDAKAETISAEKFATFSADYQAQYAAYITAGHFIAHCPVMQNTLIRLMSSSKLTSLRDSYLQDEIREEQKKCSIIFSRLYRMQDAIHALNAWYASGKAEQSLFRTNVIQDLDNAIKTKRAESCLFEPAGSGSACADPASTPPPSPPALPRSRPRAAAFSLPEPH